MTEPRFEDARRDIAEINEALRLGWDEQRCYEASCELQNVRKDTWRDWDIRQAELLRQLAELEAE